MDIKQVNSAIMFGSFTDVELNSIIDAVKFRRASMQRVARNTLRIGSSVGWMSSKRGIRAEGTVTKIAHKYATVRDTGGILWKVPMNMLESV